MDIYGREGVNAGKHFTAIYKMESDQLTICSTTSQAIATLLILKQNQSRHCFNRYLKRKNKISPSQ